MLTMQNGGGEPHILATDTPVLLNPSTVTIPGIGDMSNLTSLSSMINITPINLVSNPSYDAIPLPHMNQISSSPHPSMMSSREVETPTAGMNMSVPMQINPIMSMNISAVSGNPVNSVPMGIISMNGMGMMEGQRGFSGGTQSMDMTMARPVNVCFVAWFNCRRKRRRER